MEKAKKSPTKGKPGRPRSEEKRVAILHAGASLFLDKGLDRTSMDAVAQAAGVSKQTVYSHFSSKEDLLEACIRNTLEAYELNGSDASMEQDLRSGLLTLSERFIDLLYDDDVLCMHRTVIGSAVTHPELARLFYGAGPRATLTIFRTFMEQHVAQGTLVVDDVQEAASLLCGMIISPAHLRAVLGVDDPLDEQARRAWAHRCVDVFLNYHAVEVAGER